MTTIKNFFNTVLNTIIEIRSKQAERMLKAYGYQNNNWI